jgi:ArsR family transcriptional regulator
VGSEAKRSDRDPVHTAVDLFKALASPIRLAAVLELRTGPRCVHQLSDALMADGRQVSQPLLSQHLKVLRDVGVVSTTRRAAEVTYQLVDERVSRLAADAVGHSRPPVPPEHAIDVHTAPGAQRTDR